MIKIIFYPLSLYILFCTLQTFSQLFCCCDRAGTKVWYTDLNSMTPPPQEEVDSIIEPETADTWKRDVVKLGSASGYITGAWDDRIRAN
jgi:hypothetical protein